MDFVEQTCPHKGCGTSFKITSGFDRIRRKDHRNFYCPNGHILMYPQQTEIEKYKSLWEKEKRLHEKLQRYIAKKDKSPKIK